MCLGLVLHFQRAARVLLFRSRLSGFCFADLLSHLCRGIFRRAVLLASVLFSSVLPACRRTVRSVLDVLFCFGWKPFSVSANVPVCARVYLRSLNVPQEGSLLLHQLVEYCVQRLR